MADRKCEYCGHTYDLNGDGLWGVDHLELCPERRYKTIAAKEAELAEAHAEWARLQRLLDDQTRERVDRVALQLFEHILSPWLDIDLAIDGLVAMTIESVPIPEKKGPDIVPDMAEVTEIARYLVVDEEMNPDAEDFELATILQLGLFIHGFQHRNDPL